MGFPKVLADQGSWLAAAIAALHDGGCRHVLVTLGAAHPQIPVPARAVAVSDWTTGVSASIRAGLAAAADIIDADYAVILTVDTPDVPAAAVARVLTAARENSGGLARAAYRGRPGHPVALGRPHWRPAAADAHADTGLRDYLRTNSAVVVECSDLATGDDHDHPTEPAAPSRGEARPPGRTAAGRTPTDPGR
jgi:CTP:molybdopterin cytidylyltransferase MocA